MKTLIASIIIVAALIWSFNSGFSKAEVTECYQWRADSIQYGKNFFLAKWQKEQCAAHHIIINSK